MHGDISRFFVMSATQISSIYMSKQQLSQYLEVSRQQTSTESRLKWFKSAQSKSLGISHNDNKTQPQIQALVTNHYSPHFILTTETMSEKYLGSLHKLLGHLANVKKQQLPDELALSFILQISMAILSMQHYSSTSHGDLYLNNIVMNEIPYNTVFLYDVSSNLEDNKLPNRYSSSDESRERKFYCRSYGWLAKIKGFGPLCSSITNISDDLKKSLTPKPTTKKYHKWEHISKYNNIDIITKDLFALLISWYSMGKTTGVISSRLLVFLEDFLSHLQSRSTKVKTKELIESSIKDPGEKRKHESSFKKTNNKKTIWQTQDLVKLIVNQFSIASLNLYGFNSCQFLENFSSSSTSIPVGENNNNEMKRICRMERYLKKKFTDRTVSGFVKAKTIQEEQYVSYSPVGSCSKK